MPTNAANPVLLYSFKSIMLKSLDSSTKLGECTLKGPFTQERDRIALRASQECLHGDLSER